MAGQKIRSGSQLLAQYTLFLTYVTENDFPLAPTHGCFCRWLATNNDGITVRQAQHTVEKYSQQVKKEMTNLLADTLAAGALKGRYNATITTLCLKNLCDWSDKQRVDTSGTSTGRWEDLIDGVYTDYREADDKVEETCEIG